METNKSFLGYGIALTLMMVGFLLAGEFFGFSLSDWKTIFILSISGYLALYLIFAPLFGRYPVIYAGFFAITLPVVIYYILKTNGLDLLDPATQAKILSLGAVIALVIYLVGHSVNTTRYNGAISSRVEAQLGGAEQIRYEKLAQIPQRAFEIEMMAINNRMDEMKRSHDIYKTPGASANVEFPKEKVNAK